MRVMAIQRRLRTPIRMELKMMTRDCYMPMSVRVKSFGDSEPGISQLDCLGRVIVIGSFA